MGANRSKTSPAVQAATAAQMRAASHDVSAWVSANAGAGKTRVLVDRVVRLLLSGTQPGAILCLTYTNAAAAEMSNRLFDRLAEWAVMADGALGDEISRLPGLDAKPGPELLQKARNLFARALETPGGLKIQTIHAFCERILQLFPLEARVPAGFSILDERKSRELLAGAIRQVLGRAGQAGSDTQSAFHHVASLLDEGSLNGLIEALAANRQVRQILGRDNEIESHLETLRELWQIPAELDHQGLSAHMAGDENFPATLYQSAADVLAEGTATDQKSARLIRRVLQPGAEPDLRFALLSSLYLTLDGKMRARLITKKPGEAHPQIKAFLEQERQKYADALKLQLLAANRSLLKLGLGVVERFEQMKRQRGLLDYDDLIAHTANLLSRSEDAEWVLFKLDGGIDHILIDEAQDTSPEQWQIINTLTSEFFAGAGARQQKRTVFAVGDEKQSIYSFQGADPKQFGAMQAHFAARAGKAHWRDVPLEVSFRSAGAILSAVDLVFANAPAAQGLSWQDGQIRHIPSRQAAGRVEIWPTEKYVAGDDEKPFPAPVDHVPQSSPDIRLADKIATCIGRWLHDGTILEAQGRPIRAGDILILVRRRGSFADAMVRALKRRNLPVAGADRMTLGEQLAVQDLMALGAFILQPDDDLSLACVLKSPLIGLDEDELITLAAGRKGSLWRALSAACKQEDAPPALSDAHQRLRGWTEAGLSLRPYEFYAGLLDGQGLRREMIARLGSEADDPLSEFLAQALNFEQDHLPGLQGFLAWMDSGETQIKRDMEHGKDEVRVMTVHGAKGLEAGIVFLPDTCRVPNASQGRTLLDLPGGQTRLPVWPVRKNLAQMALEEAYEAVSTSQREEYHRLLYVAMTRARDALYICGFETKNGRQKDCWYDLVHNALAPLCERIEQGLESGTQISIESGTENGIDERFVLRLRFEASDADTTEQQTPEPPHEDLPAPIPDWMRARPGTQGQAAAAAPAPSHRARLTGLAPFTGGGLNRFARGNLVHALLEYLPGIAPSERRARAALFLARPGCRCDAALSDGLIDEVLAVIEHPDTAPWFGPESRAEAPFAALTPDGEASGAAQGQPVYGQIDRIAILQHEVRILDYKTSRPVPEGLDDIAEGYLRQMAAYRNGMRRIFPGKSIHCALLWTDGPVLSALPDALLDRFE